MHQKHIQILGLLLEATRSRRAAWRRENEGIHRTDLAGIPCRLHFRPPLWPGAGGTEADAVEVKFGSNALTFYAGSEGYDLVEDILAAAYPESLERTRAVARQLDEMIVRIEAAA